MGFIYIYIPLVLMKCTLYKVYINGFYIYLYSSSSYDMHTLYGIFNNRANKLPKNMLLG